MVVVYYTSDPTNYQANREMLRALTADEGVRLFVFHTRKHFSHRIRPESHRVTVYEDAHFALPLLRADLLLSTHGSEECLFPRGARRGYLFHSLSDLAVYRPNEFDEYDCFFCPGPRLASSLAIRLKERGREARLIACVGYPRLDQVLARAAHTEVSPTADGRHTIVFAPTFDHPSARPFAILSSLGAAVVRALIGRYRVIFRPHPLNRRDGCAAAVRAIFNEHRENPDFVFDESFDTAPSYARASAMVTDMSGTAVTFALGLQRPVVFVQPSGSSCGWIPASLMESIGMVVERPPDVPRAVQQAIENSQEFARRIRLALNDEVSNPGRSLQTFTEVVVGLLADKRVDRRSP